MTTDSYKDMPYTDLRKLATERGLAQGLGRSPNTEQLIEALEAQESRVETMQENVVSGGEDAPPLEFDPPDDDTVDTPHHTVDHDQKLAENRQEQADLAATVPVQQQQPHPVWQVETREIPPEVKKKARELKAGVKYRSTNDLEYAGDSGYVTKLHRGSVLTLETYPHLPGLLQQGLEVEEIGDFKEVEDDFGRLVAEYG